MPTIQESFRRRSVRAMCATTLLLTVLLTAPGSADDRIVFSGPQVGESLPPLSIRSVLGPQAGKDRDLIAEAGADPVLLVFVHERTRPAFGLANLLMRFAATRQDDGLQRGLIYLTDDPTASQAWMKRISDYFETDTMVGVSLDGPEGPGAYGLNRNVALTILVGKDGKTTANFALVQPSIQADGPKIIQAVVDVTGGGEAPDITKFLPQGMRARARMQRQSEGDARLQQLLGGVTQAEASEEDVRKAAKAVEAYLAKTPAAGKQLGALARRIVDSQTSRDNGNAVALEKLKAWADKYAPASATPRTERKNEQ